MPTFHCRTAVSAPSHIGLENGWRAQRWGVEVAGPVIGSSFLTCPRQRQRWVHLLPHLRDSLASPPHRCSPSSRPPSPQPRPLARPTGTLTCGPGPGLRLLRLMEAHSPLACCQGISRRWHPTGKGSGRHWDLSGGGCCCPRGHSVDHVIVASPPTRTPPSPKRWETWLLQTGGGSGWGEGGG